MNKLKSAVTDEAMLVAVHFSIVAEMPLGPDAFDSSKSRRP